MFSRKLTRPIAIGTAAIAVAIGAYAIVNAGSNNGASGTANAAMLSQPGQNQRVVGQVPQNWRPGTGTIITGAAANEAKAAALAKYPGGTVNRVLKLSDGSYAGHMIKISWPHHVFVSKNFKVTGAPSGRRAGLGAKKSARVGAARPGGASRGVGGASGFTIWR